MRRSGDVSGDDIAGGNGWMSFGTTTRSLPNTKIAPALFAVPREREREREQKWNKRQFSEGCKLTEAESSPRKNF